YAEEDINDWLDEDLAAKALALRGEAYYHLKDGEQARADLEQAQKLAPSQSILAMLADNELNNCENPERALEWHRAVLDFRGSTSSRIMSRSYLQSASILREAKRYEEALAILNEAGPEDMTGSSAYSYYSAIGGVLRDQGRTDEALKTYRQALEIEGMSDRHKELLQEAIAAIVSPAA
ncbi:MAG: tetratricopeptide repeat protein, partial [Lentisphaerae bacterium]|nr:tetratricopeptide repeat protein [Lentisphaerota bacterium]